MKYKAFALLPLLLAVLFIAVALAAGDARPSVLTVANEGGKLLAFAGAVVAAVAFERGDYLRRAWVALGASFLLLLVHDGLKSAAAPGSEMLLLRGTVVVIANVCSVGGTWMLARAWAVAGLDEDDAPSRNRRRTVFLGAIVVSFAITGWPLMSDARSLLQGDPGGLVNVVSDLGDTLTLALVLPVLQTTYAMRGGVLWWTWGLLAMSNAAWVVYDAISSALDIWHVGAGAALVLSESLRVVGSVCAFSAGIVQRFAVKAE